MSGSELSAELSAALLYHQQGRLEQAKGLYNRILAREPRHFTALHNLGIASCQQGRFDEGARLFSRAVQVDPGSADAHVSLGRARQALGDHAESINNLRAALALRPNDVIALNHLGMSHAALGQHAAALDSYEQALRVQPEYLEALYNSGNALAALGRAEEALGRYDAVLALRPSLADALNNRGNVLQTLGRRTEALASYQQALSIRPDFADAVRNTADALQSLQRHGEALAHYDQLPPQVAGLPDVCLARATSLSALGRAEAALVEYRRAIAARGDDPRSLVGAGYLLYQLGRISEARELFERAVRIDETYPYLAGMCLHAALSSCDWERFESKAGAVIEAVRLGKRAIDPLAFLAVCDSPQDQLTCARTWAMDQGPQPERLWQGERYAHERIRIAYLSADFRDHAVAHLAAGLFERHDRDRFEIFAVSFGPTHRDAMRVRLESAFERFFEVSGLSDTRVAQLLRENEIDVAVDLMGFTAGSRPGILMLRPAPVQISYLGFAGTMGASHIDYLIADRTVIPASEESGYSEEVVCLPYSFQVNDDRRSSAAPLPTRQELGLPDPGFVFCCFNNVYKIAPAVFDIWMRLLRGVDGSVLWLSQGNPVAADNLRREAQKRGVAADRLIFAPQTADLADHLVRQRRADLFLDTLPYNAHTTASDALYVGLPIVTCLGNAFAGRVCASLLRAVGLGELITRSAGEYEALAYCLATEPQTLAGIRRKLADNLRAAPLFDTDRFRQDIERAYLRMWQQRQAGLPPAAFELQAT